MKNIFLNPFRTVAVLLFLAGPFASKGASYVSPHINQAIVFEMFEAIKNGDSKNYEGLFYELAINLGGSRDFERLLSMTDEAGNNIFHLMAGVSPESPAFSFFLKEMGNLLAFLTLPKGYYYDSSLPLKLPSFGGMTYSEMPQTIKLNQGSMKLESVIKNFLKKENNKMKTPLMIARDNKILPDLDTIKQFHNIYVNSIYHREKRLKTFKQSPLARRPPYYVPDPDNERGVAAATWAMITFTGFIIPALPMALSDPFGEVSIIPFIGAAIGFAIGYNVFLDMTKDLRRRGRSLYKEHQENDCYKAIAKWKANVDHI